MTQTMRERLIEAVERRPFQVASQYVPAGAPRVETLRLIRRDAEALVDAILAELRTPDEGMVLAGTIAGDQAVETHDPDAAHDCNIHPTQPPAIFTAMIDHVRSEKL